MTSTPAGDGPLPEPDAVHTPGTATDPSAPAPPAHGTRTFVHVLVNTALANVTTSFLWFGITFWIYLETRNVLATGVIGGAYMLLVAMFSMFFGTLVDRFRKKAVMVWATLVSLALFLVGGAYFFLVPHADMVNLGLPHFWIFAIVMLTGAIAEQLRNIALSTTVTLLVPVDRRANANGMVGTVQGLAMLVTSVFSGLAIGQLGMGWTIVISITALGLVFLHLLWLRIPEPKVLHVEEKTSWIDIKVGWRTVRSAPGLLMLVLFTTLNNLVGGVYMALMDPYGLTLFSVETWGIVFAIASTGFIIGGIVLAKFGLGRNPIRTMLLIAAFIGVVGGVFAIREWAWLFVLGCWIYMAFIPAVEAAEQTVIQTVTPYEKQGRVFGFAMTFEAAAAPITSFLIAPIAEFVIIPALDTPEGQQSWAWLLGYGEARGIALVFLFAGLAAMVLALGAFLTPAYRLLSKQFMKAKEQAEEAQEAEKAIPGGNGSRSA